MNRPLKPPSNGRRTLTTSPARRSCFRVLAVINGLLEPILVIYSVSNRFCKATCIEFRDLFHVSLRNATFILMCEVFFGEACRCSSKKAPGGHVQGDHGREGRRRLSWIAPDAKMNIPGKL